MTTPIPFALHLVTTHHKTMNSTIAGLALVAAAVIGSASIPGVAHAQADGAAPAPAPKAQKSSRDVLTRADLDAKASANLHVVISAMRSHWLRASPNARSNMSITSRGSSGGGGFMQDPDASPTTGVGVAGGSSIAVYVDGRRFGAVAALRSMPAETVEKVCYFPLNRAQNRFGMEVESPVIEVFTRGSSYAQTDC